MKKNNIHKIYIKTLHKNIIIPKKIFLCNLAQYKIENKIRYIKTI